MKRSEVYDTRSSIRRRHDLGQSAVIGILSAALTVVGFRFFTGYPQAALTTLGALFVYFTLIALPNRAQLLTLILFSASFALAPAHVLHFERVFVFALMIALSLRLRYSIMPFFAVGASWVALFIVNSKLLPGVPALAPIGPEFLRSAVLETFGILVVLFLCWSNRLAERMHRVPRPVDTFSLLIAVSFIAVSSTALVLCRTFATVSGITLQALWSDVSDHKVVVALAIVALLLTPLLCGLALTQLVKDFTSQLAELGDPGKRVFKPAHGLPMLREFQSALLEVRQILDGLAGAHKETAFTLKEVLSKHERVSFDFRVRERDRAQLLGLLQDAPFGLLAVTGSGAVISTNDAFFKLLHLESGDFVGKHFAAMAGEEREHSECLAFLATVLRDPKFLSKGETVRKYVNSELGTLLELEVRSRKSAPDEFADTYSLDQLAPSDISVLLCVRRVGNLRDFQLRSLGPTTLLLLGCQAIESCREFEQRLRRLTQSINQASPELNAFFQDARLQHYSEVGLLLGEFQQFSADALADIESITSRINPKAEKLKRVDLGQVMQDALPHLLQLLGSSQTVPVEIDSDLDESEAEHIIAELNPTEFTTFLGSFLSVIHALLPKAANLRISVGLESIGAGTATIIPGSSPGQYARITLQHSGQSITANMLPESLLLLDSSIEEPGEIEPALALLTLSTQRLSGFLSVQSSSAKGTLVTIYIPEAPHLVDRRPREFSRPALRDNPSPRTTKIESRPPLPLRPGTGESRTVDDPVEYTPATSGESPRVLLLSSSIRLTESITASLQRLQYVVTNADPFSAISGEDEELSFGGSGFASSDSTALNAVANVIDERVRDYRLVIVEVSSFAEAAQELVNQVRSFSEEVPILVIGADPPDDEAQARASAYLNAPITDDLLKRATTRLIR